VFCAVLPARGLGVALKCDDGLTRAAEAAMTAVLARLLPAHAEALRRWTHAAVPTRRGVTVGEVRAVAEAFDRLS
jgi:L-asparaginase II